MNAVSDRVIAIRRWRLAHDLAKAAFDTMCLTHCLLFRRKVQWFQGLDVIDMPARQGEQEPGIAQDGRALQCADQLIQPARGLHVQVGQTNSWHAPSVATMHGDSPTSSAAIIVNVTRISKRALFPCSKFENLQTFLERVEVCLLARDRRLLFLKALR